MPAKSPWLLVSLLGAAVGGFQYESEDPACLLQRQHKSRRLIEADEAREHASPQNELSLSWYILGITDYTTTQKVNSYAWVTAHPGGANFKSRVTRNNNKGMADLHVYLPTSAQSAKIDIFRDHIVDGLIGDVVVELTPNPSWCKLDVAASIGCSFSKQIEKWSWSLSRFRWVRTTLGTVNGYLATGAFLEKQVESLHLRGVAVKYLDYDGTKNRIALHRIRNDNIANELGYAKTGSVFPKSLHGIWWMDQRGVHLPIPSDPSYKQVCHQTADEVLMSWGMADWDPVTRCATGVSLGTSSPLKGEWTYMDQTGKGESAEHALVSRIRAQLDFCFTKGKDDELDIWLWFSLNSLANSIIGISPFEWSVLTNFPRQLLNFRMVKQPWGWDRQSRTLLHDLHDFIFRAFGGIMGSAGFEKTLSTCHYPLFQVIDGDGQPTEHYEAYLRFANKQTTCSESTFECPLNRGNGTMLMGRLKA